MSISIPNQNVTSDGIQTFTIVLTDYILNPDKDGHSEYDSIDPSKIRVPTNLVNMGLPPTLSAVIAKFGANNVRTQYYATPSGSLPKFQYGCAPNNLLLKGGWDSNGDNSQLYQTIVTTFNSSTQNQAIVSAPVLLQTATNPYVVTKMKTDSKDTTGGTPVGPCAFGNDGSGWDNTSVTVSIDVTVSTLKYCTIMGNNYVHDSDFCYQYVGDYINKFGSNTTLDNYMSDLCNRTFYQDTSLDVFNTPLKSPMDAKYYQICACNMPEDDYDQMKQSIINTDPDINISNIVPKCLFNPCVSSNFKPTNTEGCNAPSCLNIISMKNDNIPNLTIDQTCNINSSDTNSDPDDGDGDGGNGDSTTSNKYGWLWATGILLVIVVIIIIIVFIVVTKNNKKKGNLSKSSNRNSVVNKNVAKKFMRYYEQ